MDTANKPPLTVAQVVRPAQGGIRRHVSLLLRETVVRGISNVLYAPAPFVLDSGADQLNIQRVNLEISASTRPLQDLKLISSLTRQLPQKNTLVHAHGLRAALIGCLAAHRAGLPSIFTAHNLPPAARLGTLQRTILRLIGNRASAIIAVSQAVKSALVEIGITAEKVSVIPNGIDLDAYTSAPSVSRSAFGISESANVIGFVGRLSPEKGADNLIRAFQSLPGSEQYLVIVGDGPQKPQLIELAANNNNIKFLGYREDVAAIMKICTLVCVPSLEEGQGITVLEAMACGIPVLASDAGGLKETTADGKRAVQVPAGDQAALIQKLQELLADDSLKETLSTAAFEYVHRECSLNKQISATISVYYGVMQNHNKANGGKQQ